MKYALAIPYIFHGTEPAEEPLTLSEVKSFLRIDHTDEDASLNQIIKAARIHAERFMKRSLITQSWLMTYDDYAPSRVPLLRGPVQSVTSVTLVARDGSQSILPANTYYLNAGKEILTFDSVPFGHIVEIDYVAGYGNAAAVPHDIKQGLLALISALYEARPHGIDTLPNAAQELFGRHRLLAM